MKNKYLTLHKEQLMARAKAEPSKSTRSAADLGRQWRRLGCMEFRALDEDGEECLFLKDLVQRCGGRKVCPLTGRFQIADPSLADDMNLEDLLEAAPEARPPEKRRNPRSRDLALRFFEQLDVDTLSVKDRLVVKAAMADASRDCGLTWRAAKSLAGGCLGNVSITGREGHTLVVRRSRTLVVRLG